MFRDSTIQHSQCLYLSSCFCSSFQAIMYVIFLIILSLALGLGATTNEPTSYQEKVDRIRGFCEVMSILFSVFYMCIEIEQFIRYEM